MIWLLLPVAALAAAAFAFWVYLRRELPIPRRGTLAVLRTATLAVLLLLLWNPSVPGDAGLDAGVSRWILLDASLSMTASDPRGGTPWERARARAEDLARSGGRVVPFAEGVEPAGADTADAPVPDGAPTLLVPALERAAEAGAPSIVVLSDLRVLDEVGVRAALERLRLDVRFEDVGGEVRNVGVSGVTVPSAVEADEPVELEVRLHGEGGDGTDSVTVTVREEDRLVAERRVPLPERGRRARLGLTLPAPEAEGAVRYAVRVSLDGDGFPLDDERVAWVDVDPEAGGLVLVSTRPDWEPRFLLPVLGQVTGLRVEGWLRVGDDRWLEIADEGEDPTTSTDTEALRERVAAAELLVVHGAGADVPEWLREVVAEAGRVLLFPRDAVGAGLLDIATGGPLRGEWYASPDLPPSPMAADLAGLDPTGLPPLTDVLPLTRRDRGDVALRVHLGGSGAGEAALLLGSEGRRRWAAALASGFWRWGFRQGAARDAYRRIWAGTSAWLLGNEALAEAGDVEPARRVFPRDALVAWRAGARAGEPVALRLFRGDTAVADTTVDVPDAGTFLTPSLPPGTYRYEASLPGEPGTVGQGRFDVEAWTDELALAPMAPPEAGGAAGLLDGLAEGGGRPVRTHPLPYLLILALLCGEWVARRRAGLR